MGRVELRSVDTSLQPLTDSGPYLVYHVVVWFGGSDIRAVAVHVVLMVIVVERIKEGAEVRTGIAAQPHIGKVTHVHRHV